MIVDNRPGGNGSVGAQAVARSPADGLTLLVTLGRRRSPPTRICSASSPTTAKDFTPIIVLCRGTPVLVVNAEVPAKSVQELIALAKAKPGTLNYGSYGVGTYAHLSMEDFKQRTGTDIVHIPYRGAAPAAQALLAGDVSMLLLNLSSIEEHEKTGKVRILAAAGDKRAAARPDLPTIAEAGVPGFSTTVWFALFGPANMPAGAGEQDSRRRQQGAGPAADQGVLREEQLRAGRSVARRSSRKLIERRFQALGGADQAGRREGGAIELITRNVRVPDVAATSPSAAARRCPTGSARPACRASGCR